MGQKLPTDLVGQLSIAGGDPLGNTAPPLDPISAQKESMSLQKSLPSVTESTSLGTSSRVAVLSQAGDVYIRLVPGAKELSGFCWLEGAGILTTFI